MIINSFNIFISTTFHCVLQCCLTSDKNEEVRKDELLPHVGKIIFKLLGNKYRILYQAKDVLLFEGKFGSITK